MYIGAFEKDEDVSTSDLFIYLFIYCAGMITVWSLMFGREPIHRYQHNQKIQAMALSAEGATIATASAFQVKVESANDKGYWETAAEFEIQKLVSDLRLGKCGREKGEMVELEVLFKTEHIGSLPYLKASKLLQVNSLCLVPRVTGRPVAVATTDEAVYLLKAGESDKVLHSVYGQPITCLDVSANEAAFGVKGFGWLLNETNKVVKPLPL